MANLVLIETSTRVCSVGIAIDEELVSIREDRSDDYSHSALLTVFIEQVLEESGLSARDIDGVGVSQGPGSFTGLRIGVSAAKGFCYALDIPLVAVDTLQALAHLAFEIKALELASHPRVELPLLICPMIDARRMEVYYAIFDQQLEIIESARAKVIEEDSFEKLLAGHRIGFVGDGSSKCAPLLKHLNAMVFSDVLPSVRGMTAQAIKKFKSKDFVDLAYFEPFYLKDFVAGIPKVKGLYR